MRPRFTPTFRSRMRASGWIAPRTNQAAAELASPGTSISKLFNGPGPMLTLFPFTEMSAPMARSIRSVWSRVAEGWWTTVRPSAPNPANSTADLTWALATGRVYSMPCNPPPRISKGGNRSPSLPKISAPMRRNGSITRRMGRWTSEASPVSTERKGREASTPDIIRMVVPLFRTSSTCSGSRNPSRPRPAIVSLRPFEPGLGVVHVNFDAEGAKATHRCLSVFSVQKVVDDCRALGEAPKHGRPVGDALIAGRLYLSGEGLGSLHSVDHR